MMENTECRLISVRRKHQTRRNNEIISLIDANVDEMKEVITNHIITVLSEKQKNTYLKPDLSSKKLRFLME